MIRIKLPKTLFFMGAVSFTLMIASCGKWRERRDMTTSKDHSLIEGLMDDMYKIADNVASATPGIKILEFGCVDTLVIDTTSNPRSIMVDFGQDNCVGNDGRVRKGQLHISFTGRYRTPGTTITIVPSDFSIDGYNIYGNKTITHEGLNDAGLPYFSVSVEAQIVAPNNEWTTSWSSTRTRTWVEGYESLLNPNDDVYHITGAGSGVNRNGIAFTMNIDEALVAKINCPWIVQGVMTLTPEEGAEKVINWGNGDCNNGLTVTVGNNDFEINGGN
jgi:hypothetical protein